MKNQYPYLLNFSLFVCLSFCSLQFASAIAVDSLELPIAAFDIEETNICGSEYFTIINQSQNFEEVIWNIEEVAELFVLQDGSARGRFHYNVAGVYDVTLIAVNECGSDTLIREDYLTVNGTHIVVSQEYFGHQCGKGEVYKFCAESDYEIAEYLWNQNCLSGLRTEQCCELGLKRSSFAHTVGVWVDFEEGGCEGYNQREVYGDWDYVKLDWVNGPAPFCEGEPASLPSNTVACYPPGCTVSYGDVDTSVPGTYYVPTELYYRTCTLQRSIGVEILAKPSFKKSYDTICTNQVRYIEFNHSGANSEIQLHINGGSGSAEPNPYVYFLNPGTYEITASNVVLGEYGNSCLSKDTLFMTVLEQPEIELQYPEKVCRDTSESVTIIAESIEGTPPYSYEWKLNGTPIEADTSVLTIPISELPNMNYAVFLTITHANGCSSEELRADFTVDICSNINDISTNLFTIYQINPNQIFIKSKNIPIGNFKAVLYNLAGMKILQQNFFNSSSKLEEKIELQNVQSGVYILKLQGENGKVWNQKVWIQ